MKNPTLKLEKFAIKFVTKPFGRNYFTVKSLHENEGVDFPQYSSLFQKFIAGVIHTHSEKLERKNMQVRYERFCERVNKRRDLQNKNEK